MDLSYRTDLRTMNDINFAADSLAAMKNAMRPSARP